MSAETRTRRWTLQLRRVGRLLVLTIRYWVGPLLLFLLRRAPDATAVGVRLRLYFQDLGLMYIKLGQFLASRFDLLPIAVCRELGRLFEDVEPMPFPEAIRLIEAELGRSPADVFAEIDEDPLGSASVSQVHRARTQAGDVVALKIRRPGVQAIFEADIRNTRWLAGTVDRLGLLRGTPLTEVVDEFAFFTRRELNFELEARTMERVRRESPPGVLIPRVDWETTTSGLLTMEYVDGVSMAKAIAVLEAEGPTGLDRLLPGVDLGEVSERLSVAVLHQLFVSGFFQADPHPGNILIRKDGVVALIDFGIYGQLGADRVEILARYVEYLTLGNIDEAYRIYTRLIEFSPDTDVGAFKRAAKSLLRRYYEAISDTASPLVDRHLGGFADALLRLLYEYRIRLDISTLLFWRALIVLDSTSLRPTPDFDLLRIVREFLLEHRPNLADRILRMTFDPRRTLDLIALTQLAPRETATRLRDARQGRLYVRVRAHANAAVRRRERGQGLSVVAATAIAAIGAAGFSTGVETLEVAFIAMAGSAVAWSLIRLGRVG